MSRLPVLETNLDMILRNLSGKWMIVYKGLPLMFRESKNHFKSEGLAKAAFKSRLLSDDEEIEELVKSQKLKFIQI